MNTTQYSQYSIPSSGGKLAGQFPLPRFRPGPVLLSALAVAILALGAHPVDAAPRGKDRDDAAMARDDAKPDSQAPDDIDHIKPKAAPEKQAAPGRKAAKSSPKANQPTKVPAAQSHATELASSLTPSQRAKLLALLNEGEAEALSAISGVGGARGRDIVKARPFERVEDLREVKGIGAKVFADVIAHAERLSARRGAKLGAK